MATGCCKNITCEFILFNETRRIVTNRCEILEVVSGPSYGAIWKVSKHNSQMKNKTKLRICCFVCLFVLTNLYFDWNNLKYVMKRTWYRITGCIWVKLRSNTNWYYNLQSHSFPLISLKKSSPLDLVTSIFAYKLQTDESKRLKRKMI